MGAWQAHLTRDWDGVEFVDPDGRKLLSRLDEGRIGPDLHRLFGPWRGEAGDPREGWRLVAPSEWKGQPNLDEDGTFRFLYLADPDGGDLMLEFHYHRGTPALLLALRELVGQQQPDKEDDHGNGQLQPRAVPAAGGPAEAAGAGLLDAEERQEGGALRGGAGGRGQGGREVLRPEQGLTAVAIDF